MSNVLSTRPKLHHSPHCHFGDIDNVVDKMGSRSKVVVFLYVFFSEFVYRHRLKTYFILATFIS